MIPVGDDYITSRGVVCRRAHAARCIRHVKDVLTPALFNEAIVPRSPAYLCLQLASFDWWIVNNLKYHF